MGRVVTPRFDDSGKTLFGDGEESVWRSSGFDGVDGDINRSVLESVLLCLKSW